MDMIRLSIAAPLSLQNTVLCIFGACCAPFSVFTEDPRGFIVRDKCSHNTPSDSSWHPMPLHCLLWWRRKGNLSGHSTDGIVILTGVHVDLLRGHFCGFELAKVRTERVLERELTVPVSEYGGRYSQRTFVAFDSRRMDDTVEHPQCCLRSVLRLASVFLPWHKSPRMHATLGGFMHSPTWGVGY